MYRVPVALSFQKWNYGLLNLRPGICKNIDLRFCTFWTTECLWDQIMICGLQILKLQLLRSTGVFRKGQWVFWVEKRRPKMSTISILKNFQPANVTILIILTWNMGQKCSGMARCFSRGWYLMPKSSYHPFLVCSNNHITKNPIFHFSQTTHFLIWHNFDTKNYPKVFGDGSLF